MADIRLDYAFADVANPLESEIYKVLSEKAAVLAEIREGRYTRSQDIEKCLQEQLNALGFVRSATSQSVAGLFALHSDFEIDFWHPTLKVAIEVEKGKHFNLWRNLVKFCESPLIEHGVLIVPAERQGSQGAEAIFNNTLDSLRNVESLYRELKSLLCYGY